MVTADHNITASSRQQQIDASVPFGKQVAMFQHGSNNPAQQPQQESSLTAVYQKFNGKAAQEIQSMRQVDKKQKRQPTNQYTVNQHMAENVNS